VPPRDRGRYQGLIGAVFGAASIIGPALGGFIVDNTSWRWIFYVNLPVGGLALVVISVTMPRRAPLAKRSVDWLGAVLLGLSSTALLLGLVWGGRDYPWASPHVLGALGAAAVAFGSFLLYERRVPETILPFELLRNRVVVSSLVCMALVGMAMFGTISFVPLFVQGVIGTSATSSGVVLTPLLLGAVIASATSGQWVSRSGRTRPNAIVGSVVLTAGMVLLWRMGAATTNGQAARNMVVVGVGLGLMMQVFVLVVQNAVPRHSIGSATALTQFARSMGGTLGVTLMGVIVNQGLPSRARTSGVTFHKLHGPLRITLAHAIRPAFFAGMIVSALVLPVVLTGIKDVRLRRAFEETGAERVAAAAGAPSTRAE
jgi:MFS family permease